MTKTINKLLALLLALSLLAGLAGCAPVEEPEETEPPVAVKTEKKDPCTELGTPLADLRIRQALAYAIDMDTVIEALFYDNARRAVSFTAPLGDELASYEYDPEKAKELLAEAQWPSDYVMDVVYYYDDQQTVDVLSVIGSYWEAVGVQAEFRKLEGDLAAQLWTRPADMESGVEWDLAYGAVAALTNSEFYNRFASDASNNSHTPEIEGLDGAVKAADYQRVQQLLAENAAFLPLFHQNCFIYTSDHIDTAGAVHGNDQFAYDKDILNWTTDREDNTLYTDGGPESFFSYPVVNPGLYLYQELIFERLLASDSELNPGEGQLAESYILFEDGKTLEFTLWEELYWQDGEPLTAEDVKFTFELYMQCPGANSVLSGVLNTLEGAKAFRDGETEECIGITVEENKVTFRFEEQSADMLTVFAQWPVLPKHKLEDVRPEKLQQNKFWKNPIGSGPYKVSEVKLGDYCILERWEDYRLEGEGNIDRIYMVASGETDADLAVLAQLDRIDYAWGKATDDAAYIENLEGMNVAKVEIPYTRCFFINQYDHESRIALQMAEEETTAPTE